MQIFPRVFYSVYSIYTFTQTASILSVELHVLQ